MLALGPFLKWVGLALAVLILTVAAWITHPQWLPLVSELAKAPPKKDAHGHAHGGHDQAGRNHAHDDMNSLELSVQGRKNIGLTPDLIQPIKLTTYTRSITIPGIVVGLPGKTKLEVVAPTTGVITELIPVPGASIAPGQPLFKLRLLHEDLLQAQTDFLKTLGELDVEKKEIKRLDALTKQGIVAEKELLERQYAKHKLEAVFASQQASLLLHGLTETQVEAIVDSRKLISDFVLYAPTLTAGNGIQSLGQGNKSPEILPDNPGAPNYLVVQDLKVARGSFVTTGAKLCDLADVRKLYIQGQAFEQDGEELVQAIKKGWTVTALIEDRKQKSQAVSGLKIAYLENEIEPESRALHFYVELPNQVLDEKVSAGGARFVTWKFKPGQRLQLQVPVEHWEKRIVLPVDAVAQDGAEAFVFVENGDHFDRKPVHLEHKDQLWAVLANDGSVFPNERVAMTAAHQMLIALKNKAGGGVDPHAGHTH